MRKRRTKETYTILLQINVWEKKKEEEEREKNQLLEITLQIILNCLIIYIFEKRSYFTFHNTIFFNYKIERAGTTPLGLEKDLFYFSLYFSPQYNFFQLQNRTSGNNTIKIF